MHEHIGRFWAGNVPRLGDVIHRGDETLYVLSCIGFVWPLNSTEAPMFRVTALPHPPSARERRRLIGGGQLSDELTVERVHVIVGQVIRAGHTAEKVIEWRGEVPRA